MFTYLYWKEKKKTFLFIFCCKHLIFFMDDIKPCWSQAAQIYNSVCCAFFSHTLCYIIFPRQHDCVSGQLWNVQVLFYEHQIFVFWRPPMSTVLSVSHIAHTSEMFACLTLQDSSEHLINVPAFIQDAHSRAASALNSIYRQFDFLMNVNNPLQLYRRGFNVDISYMWAALWFTSGNGQL